MIETSELFTSYKDLLTNILPNVTDSGIESLIDGTLSDIQNLLTYENLPVYISLNESNARRKRQVQTFDCTAALAEMDRLQELKDRDEAEKNFLNSLRVRVSEKNIETKKQLSAISTTTPGPDPSEPRLTYSIEYILSLLQEIFKALFSAIDSRISALNIQIQSYIDQQDAIQSNFNVNNNYCSQKGPKP